MTKIVWLSHRSGEFAVAHYPHDDNVAPPGYAKEVAERVEALRKRFHELKSDINLLNQEAEQRIFSRIRQAFEDSDCVEFLAKKHSCFEYRDVSLNGIGLLPLVFLLKALDIDAKHLQELFCGKPMSWDDYEALGSIPLDRKEFAKLAEAIRKPLKVYRDHGTGGQYYLFTVHPDGRVEEAKQSA